MDKVVIVNEKDEVIGTMPREEAHRNGAPHRIVVVYVEHPSTGQMLVQIRMTGRLDHSSAGHVDPGETYEEAAKRELHEELGISNVALTSVGKGISEEKLPQEGEHRVHVFEIFRCSAEPGILQPDEVKGVYWADARTVLQEMSENPGDMKFSGGFRASLPVYLKAGSLNLNNKK